MPLISPSILNCDYLSLEPVLRIFEQSGVDRVHLDVMDGIFVPNLTFGAEFVKSVKSHTTLKTDVHLMIDRPHRYIDLFAPFSDMLGFHLEAGSPVAETLRRIKNLGCKPYITIKPDTEPDEVFPYLPLCDTVLVMSVEPGFGGQEFLPGTLRKLRTLKEEISRRGLDVSLEVDGGINETTAPPAVAAGADILVVGSALVKAADIKKECEKYLSL